MALVTGVWVSNGALCQDVNGSGTYSGNVATLTSTGGFWCPLHDPGIAQIDLGINKTICSTYLEAYDQRNSGVNWAFDWYDGTTWQQLLTYNGAQSFNFLNQNSRYWRIRPIGGTGHYSIYSVFLYSISSLALG